MSEKNTPKRPVRIPLGTRNVLTAPPRKGYHRRFINDDGDRVKAFEAAGYEIVREDISVGDHKAGKDTQVGTVVNPSVGNGTKAVLMEIKDEYYEEDQLRKHNELKSVENGMRRSQNDRRPGEYGEVAIS